MSKYGVLSRSDGHSKWFLQKTLLEHDKSMDHPWMQMIYKQSFSLKQYAAWLALNHKVFQAMEAKFDLSVEPIRAVHDDALARTQKLEADLARLMGPEWSEESAGICSASSAAKQYLKGFEVDAADPYLLLSHHFLQYNAVLSGGAYLGEMVSQKLCVPHGAPGVKFYHFEGVQPGKEPARVQEYLRAFDQLQIDEDVRRRMLQSMKRIYADTEAMMTEIFQMNPASGVSYKTSKEGSEAGELPAPCKEQLTLSLQELREYTGEAEGRILIGLAGELLDVSSGREMYGPGGGYSVLAGHDVTRCLATMSLEPEHLDDLRWAPDCADDEEALTQWRQRLKEKYPVAGQLAASADEEGSAEGLRKRPAGKEEAKAPEAAKTEAQGDGDRCPISGKQGTCPMAAIMGIQKPSDKAQANQSPTAPSGGAFMAGKSLVASVQKKNSFEDSLLYRLCPLHWDDKTIKMVFMIAAASWMSGVFIGWNLRKMLVK
mmetsp:Transcript_8163/g.19481  ORF Transcript_8163/g.19481 Transcript_8163/m.19481 type:complete len:487 (-) Transcript_8163:88-1548(-)